MPHASPMMLCWWLFASLSAAVYFHPEVLLSDRTSLSLLVRALHVTTSMGMAFLSTTCISASRVDVGLACAGETPEAARCLLTFAVVYVGSLLSLTLETVFVAGFRRRLFLRLAQCALVGLFAQVVSHRGELLCTGAEQRDLSSVLSRASFGMIYSWAALAFSLCNRIEASLDHADDEACLDSDDESGDTFSGLKAAFAFAEDSPRAAKGSKKS